MQWAAYASFSNVRQGITIPINPQISPIFQVVPTQKKIDLLLPLYIPFSSIVNKQNKIEMDFSVASVCKSNKMIGLEIDAFLMEPQLIVLEWGGSRNDIGSKGRRLWRFYPSGSVKIHLAVDRKEYEPYFKLSTKSDVMLSTNNGIAVFCI
jgi:hypothetical protein